VVISFKIPEGLEFITGTSDSGKWTFDPLTKTLTWTLDNVVVGDPNLKITLRTLKSGSYAISPNIGANITINVTNNGEINLNIQNTTNNNTTNNDLQMPQTGTPIYYLIIAIFLIIGGLIPRNK